MGIPFTPTRDDVERYRGLRVLARDLNHKIVKTIPRRALEQIGDALGIRHNGVVELENEDMISVVMDCCLYDWLENGMSVVQRFSETHAAEPGTDEHYLLDAYLRAKYRILVVRSTVSGAGLYCEDVLNSEELFLMDLAFSRTAEKAGAALATRTIPVGEYSMTTGAALPIISKKAALDALGRIASGQRQSLEGSGSVTLTIVRACLAAGAAGHIVYQNIASKPREPRHPFRRHRH